MWKVPATTTKEVRTGNKSRRIVKRTGGEENDPGDVDLELVFHNVLEKLAVDEEWLGIVNGAVSFGLLGSILVLQIPVPFELLCWLFLVPCSTRHGWRTHKRWRVKH